MVGCERSMQEVWEKEEALGGDYLRKILFTARSLGKSSRDVMRRLLLRGGRRNLSSD